MTGCVNPVISSASRTRSRSATPPKVRSPSPIVAPQNTITFATCPGLTPQRV